MSLLVLCPSRGRPKEAAETLASFDAMTQGSTDIRFVVDADDPTLDDYEVPLLVVPPLGNMVAALNAGAIEALGFLNPTYLGFIGDDHRFRTPGWDQKVIDALTSSGGGLAFGNDLAHSSSQLSPESLLPTQVFMSASIVRALGWMALPTCRHLYVDDAWKALGTEIGKLHYLPDVVIEHLHPAYGKGEWDEGHIRVNSQEMYDHDRDAYNAWIMGSFAEDIATARAAL